MTKEEKREKFREVLEKAIDEQLTEAETKTQPNLSEPDWETMWQRIIETQSQKQKKGGYKPPFWLFLMGIGKKDSEWTN